jgi:hypothetical protein
MIVNIKSMWYPLSLSISNAMPLTISKKSNSYYLLIFNKSQSDNKIL